MRNLKKVLSLALAMVMLLGMMVVGAGAAVTTSEDYSDSEEIAEARVEAVDVMSAIEVFKGSENDAFKPEEILTREEAATIVARMLLGSAADSLKATSATYSDVDTDRWSAGYIEHCTKLGILGGYDGKFDPAGELTYVAFAKMMLCALGYEAEAEGFNGPNWAANVMSVARRAGISIDMVVNNEPMAREDAAQMAFNTLKADVVEYRYKGDGGYGNVISMTNTKTNYRVTSSDNAGNTGNGNSGNVTGGTTTPTNRGDGTMQFCELYFPALKLVEGDTNGFGDIVAEWKLVQGNTTESVSETDVAYAQQYTAYTTMSKIYRDLGMTAPHSCDLYVDGREPATITISNNPNYKVGGNGAITTVWTNENGDPLRITVKNIYVGDVVAVNTTAETVTVAPRGTTADGYISGTASGTDFAVGDVVLYNRCGGSVVNVSKPETVTGTLAAYNSRVSGVNYFIVNGNATVDSTAHEYSDKIATAANEASLKRSVRLILDTYGYLIDVEGYDAPQSYAYVIGLRQDYFETSRIIAKLVLPTGEIKEVYTNEANHTTNAQKLVHYTVDPVTGVYTLDSYKATNTNQQGTAADKVLLTKGVPTVNLTGDVATYADAKTVFIIKMGVDAYNVYLGIANVPTIIAKASQTVNGGTIATAGLAKAVYIDASQGTTNVQFSGSVADHVFVLRNPNTPLVPAGTDAAGRQYYIYNAIVNGALRNDFLATNSVTGPTLYSYVSYDAAGIATLSNPVNPANTGTSAAINNAIGLGGTAYIWDNTTLVYKVAANGGSAQLWSVAGIKDDTNDKTWVVGTSPAKLIIFQEVADSVTPPAGSVTMPAGVTVNTSTPSATTITYTAATNSGNRPTDAQIADAIRAQLKTDGWDDTTVNDVTINATAGTIAVAAKKTEGGYTVNQTFTLTKSTGCLVVYKVGGVDQAAITDTTVVSAAAAANVTSCTAGASYVKAGTDTFVLNNTTVKPGADYESGAEYVKLTLGTVTNSATTGLPATASAAYENATFSAEYKSGGTKVGEDVYVKVGISNLVITLKTNAASGSQAAGDVIITAAVTGAASLALTTSTEIASGGDFATDHTVDATFTTANSPTAGNGTASVAITLNDK